MAPSKRPPATSTDRLLSGIVEMQDDGFKSLPFPKVAAGKSIKNGVVMSNRGVDSLFLNCGFLICCDQIRFYFFQKGFVTYRVVTCGGCDEGRQMMLHFSHAIYSAKNGSGAPEDGHSRQHRTRILQFRSQLCGVNSTGLEKVPALIESARISNIG